MKHAALILVLLSALPVRADLLAVGRDWREMPFDVVDGKALVAASVNGAAGRMMIDTATPAPVFLNRDAAGIGAGEFLSEGHAASGQTIRAHRHDAPQVAIGGAPAPLPPTVMSGDFGFVEGVFGADFLGFVGTPMLEAGAFVLDYDRRVLTVLRVRDGVLAVPAPAPGDVVARAGFAIWPGGEPTLAARLGDLAILLDFDSGDQGTIYLHPETRAALLAAGAIRAEGAGLVLRGVSFGGADFADLRVRAVAAGGPDDLRPQPGFDLLRLGAGFMAEHPVIWNFPAGNLTVLRQGAAFLAPRR